MSQKNDERDLLEVVQKLWSDNHLLQSRLRQAKAAATEAIHRRSESEAAVEKERLGLPYVISLWPVELLIVCVVVCNEGGTGEAVSKKKRPEG